MRTGATLLVSTTFGFGVIVAGSSALACRCAPVDEAAHVVATPIIFTGRVTADLPEVDGRALVFTFEVSERWKGELPDVVEVRTPRSSASCGAAFKRGQTYTVFASPFRHNRFETNACQLAPFQSRPGPLEMLLKTYRDQVAAMDRRVAAATNGSKELRERLAFLLASNDWTAAAATIDALLTRSPKDEAALLIQRGLLSYRLVRLDAARADFESALRLDPKSPMASRGLAALDRLDDVAAPARPDAQRTWPESFELPAPP